MPGDCQGDSGCTVTNRRILSARYLADRPPARLRCETNCLTPQDRVDSPLPPRGHRAAAQRTRPLMPPPRPDAPDAARAETRALDGHCLLRTLGEGGMSTVYLAYKPNTQEQVAIKVLAEALAGDQLAVRRFVREVKLLTT